MCFENMLNGKNSKNGEEVFVVSINLHLKATFFATLERKHLKRNKHECPLITNQLSSFECSAAPLAGFWLQSSGSRKSSLSGDSGSDCEYRSDSLLGPFIQFHSAGAAGSVRTFVVQSTVIKSSGKAGKWHLKK